MWMNCYYPPTDTQVCLWTLPCSIGHRNSVRVGWGGVVVELMRRPLELIVDWQVHESVGQRLHNLHNPIETVADQ